MTDVVSVEPRTGGTVEVVAPETTPAEVDARCAAAAAAAPGLEALGRDGRADLLDTLADALEARRTDVVGVADRETALGQARLDGELTRTCFQLRLFGEVLREGSYVEATVDHAGDTPMGPRPDLRRMLVPLGPVAVFGASNFPLAFSVPGGDTAAALAAGCPVVVKAHGSHPATSALVAEILAAAASQAGAPDGTIGLVHGLAAGAALVAAPQIRAVGFTGSPTGATALMEIIDRRPEPIPFFGELAGLNPVVVTPAAAAERGADLGAGLVGSFTLGGGAVLHEARADPAPLRPGRRRRARRDGRRRAGGARPGPAERGYRRELPEHLGTPARAARGVDGRRGRPGRDHRRVHRHTAAPRRGRVARRPDRRVLRAARRRRPLRRRGRAVLPAGGAAVLADRDRAARGR
ncbi:aldehyde dehydrogenase family protein [Pseudonocardia sp. ICBG1142]|uniref:aldehyde dehydrogenase family protein n=1 Tax=Pseudonocardia sp. ICBG1142 TaxID=2846760 RepID=UPI0027DFDBB6|nr:aldehyde dehydrogenase family protein [Pseudonocardia sp. ICBG1142]